MIPANPSTPMKIAHAALALLLAAVLAGCDAAGEAPEWTGPTHPLEIHLQNHFEDDHVRVAIDGRTVFEGDITTEYVWSLAKIVEVDVPVGEHRLTVTRNHVPTATALFVADQPLYIGVKYFEEALPRLNIPQGFRIEVREQPYVYE